MFEDDNYKQMWPKLFVEDLKTQFGEAAWVLAYLHLMEARTKQARRFAKEMLILLGREVMSETKIPPLLAAEAFHSYVQNPIFVVEKIIKALDPDKHTYTYYFLIATITELKAMEQLVPKEPSQN